MWTKEQKKQITQRLKKAGVLGVHKAIFDRINEGATVEEITAYVDKLIADHIASLPPAIEFNKISPLNIFGKHLIPQNAIHDIQQILRLPYVIGGALMPDGHRVKEGHVPVGGVVNSEVILPDVVGNDIACSVLLTVTDMPVDADNWFQQNQPTLTYILRNESYFGQEINPQQVVQHEKFFQEGIPVESTLGKQVYETVQRIAPTQFGTSGDGNHFVEFGVSDGCFRNGQFINDGKRYLSILSHFGSRMIGSTIAKMFEDYAQQQVRMPHGIASAPLYMNTPEGADYWHLMQWAGHFAEQGHRWLHKHLLEAIDARLSLTFSTSQSIYTKHNFAWETSNGFIHRKGATPASFGELGVIPATMGDHTQIIMGLGLAESYESASHGAGRTHSRRAAFQAFSGNTAEWLWKHYKVALIGGGPDEDPRAYKKIEDVMQAQETAVQRIGHFEPKIVRMAEPRF